MLGRLFDSDARRQYRRQGYHVFRRAFPTDEVEAIASLIRQMIPAYEGKLRRQDGTFAANDFFPGTRLVHNSLLHPHQLPQDLAPLRDRLRALATAPGLGARLRQLDGIKHHTIHQTLLFLTAQSTDLHLDSWSVDAVPLGSGLTCWIPLQDMDHRSGLPSLIPWPLGKVVTEDELGLRQTGTRDQQYDQYHRALRALTMDGSPEAVTPLVRMGDLVVWSSLTPHFTLPAFPFPAERLSLQMLVRPAKNRWGDFLEQPYDRTSVEVEQVNEYFSLRIVT